MRHPAQIRPGDIFGACRAFVFICCELRCHNPFSPFRIFYFFPLVFPAFIFNRFAQGRERTHSPIQSRRSNEYVMKSCSHHDNENMFINFIIRSRTIAETSSNCRLAVVAVRVLWWSRGARVCVRARIALALRLAGKPRRRKIIIFIWEPLKMRVCLLMPNGRRGQACRFIVHRAGCVCMRILIVQRNMPHASLCRNAITHRAEA